MKKDVQEIREKDMQKFKMDKPADGAGDELLDDLNDELEAARGKDSDDDVMGGIIDAAGNEYRKVGGGPNEPITPRLGLFLP
jgi:hypothetical protein